MKHELTLKLLEQGQAVDQELLAKLLAVDKPGAAARQKSIAEEHLDGGSFMTLLFVIPGMIMMALDIVKSNPEPTEDEIRAGLAGNFCRCTGYQNIVNAVKAGAAAMKEAKP